MGRPGLELELQIELGQGARMGMNKPELELELQIELEQGLEWAWVGHD